MMKFLFFFLTVTLFMTSCEKKPFNFRNKYIGTWSFTVKRTAYQLNQGITLDDTVYYEGNIEYGSEKNELVIHYLENEKVTMLMDIKDSLYKQNADPHVIDMGKFTDKKHLELTTGYHGLGGSSRNDVKGVKIK